MQFTNEQLATLIQQGNTIYCSLLWERLKALLFVYAYKTASRYPQLIQERGLTVDDLLQECYFIMLEVVRAYKPENGLKLTSYTKYQALNHFNTLLGFRGKNDTLNICDSLNVGIDEAGECMLIDTICDETAIQAYDDVDSRQYNEQLHIDLENAFNEVLDDEQTNYIKLRYYDNMSYDEISNRCNVTYDKVRSQLQIARKKLSRYNKLKPYHTAKKYDIWHGTGLIAFKHRGCSNIEYAVEKAIGNYENNNAPH